MMAEPIRVLAEYEHGPYDFEKYPDDLDTLQRDGTSCMATTDLLQEAGMLDQTHPPDHIEVPDA